eukprot:TRINITY_DN11092_c0_g2_i3.p1 TRINITY_DN11092_c0_g2~~TRINITY_DN11092_c0_g2_i3.p1  ORF type:complete len:505 (+),score=104.52 TRINITY_DN11092_c0_g2_i3:60-1517(+)
MAAQAAPSLAGEYGNIALLLLLYTLQGIPMGLFGFVNLEVKELFKGSFSEQGTFMLAAWPFSLKLFWAPLVDSWYVEKFGRRKTWMVPAQVCIGVILLYLSSHIDGLFDSKDVWSLTVIFFGLYFLCATQDIAVDGWALTMLRTENAGYASTCNAVGQTVGFTIGFMIPMAKVVSISSFLLFWGIVFLASTAAVALMKTEKPTDPSEEIESLQDAYVSLYRVVRLPSVQKLALHLFTRSLTFMPADVIAPGRLQDAGFPKESLASIKLVVTPLEIFMPWVLAPFTAGERPLRVVVVSYIPRLLLTVFSGVFAYYAGDIQQPTPMLVYAGVCLLVVLQAVASNAMFVAHMAFFAKISDPTIGGTYMTLLNTVHNLGNMWASTFCLKAADYIKTATGIDGFYALCAGCTVYGLVWLLLFRPLLDRLSGLPSLEWRIPSEGGLEAADDDKLTELSAAKLPKGSTGGSARDKTPRPVRADSSKSQKKKS